jgi:hypothetical protein
MRHRVLYALARLAMQRNSVHAPGSPAFLEGVETLIPLLDERLSTALVELIDGGDEWRKVEIR